MVSELELKEIIGKVLKEMAVEGNQKDKQLQKQIKLLKAI